MPLPYVIQTVVHLRSTYKWQWTLLPLSTYVIPVTPPLFSVSRPLLAMHDFSELRSIPTISTNSDKMSVNTPMRFTDWSFSGADRKSILLRWLMVCQMRTENNPALPRLTSANKMTDPVANAAFRIIVDCCNPNNYLHDLATSMFGHPLSIRAMAVSVVCITRLAPFSSSFWCFRWQRVWHWAD